MNSETESESGKSLVRWFDCEYVVSTVLRSSKDPSSVDQPTMDITDVFVEHRRFSTESTFLQTGRKNQTGFVLSMLSKSNWCIPNFVKLQSTT